MRSDMNNIMQFHNHCCGCGECYSICPVNAISMIPNEQGFLYPQIDESKCINCAKCVRHCSFNQKYSELTFQQEYYAVKHCDENVRASSRSGGIFTALSDQILNLQGVVYGCALFNNNKAVHIRATTEQDRDLMRGSKYIQSETYQVFDDVKKDLTDGRWVLFSGTPCQVAGIKDYCQNVDNSKLLLVDIVCYGVPSSKVWRDYLDYIEKINHKRIANVDFRDKTHFGWADHKETAYFTDGTSFSNDIFKDLFYSHRILRKNCFECPYKNLNRVGDISIADCWGISTEYPEFDDNKGVSLVLINSQKGKQFFSALDEGAIHSIVVDINRLQQPCLCKNWEQPSNYDEFWKFYQHHSFKKIIDKYVYHKAPFVKKVMRRLKRMAKRYVLGDK